MGIQMSNDSIARVAAKRTPTGVFMGWLSGVKTSELGATAIKATAVAVELP